jgi:hypothetical protein
MEVSSILQLASNMIGNMYKSYKMRSIFRELKQSIFKAVTKLLFFLSCRLNHYTLQQEQFMTIELLRKLVPSEASLLRDPLLHPRVRFRLAFLYSRELRYSSCLGFRFGGSSFPPKIYYKIYTSGAGMIYYCGKYMIAPGSKVYHPLPLLFIKFHVYFNLPT